VPKEDAKSIGQEHRLSWSERRYDCRRNENQENPSDCAFEILHSGYYIIKGKWDIQKESGFKPFELMMLDGIRQCRNEESVVQIPQPVISAV